MDTFAGTAFYYDRFRPNLPEELVTRLVAAAGRDSLAHSLLDIGTGTGKVLEEFLPYFKDIVAIEPSPKMLELAKRRLIPQMQPDTSMFFLDGSAEVAQFPPNWSASLVLACRSFHWLEQPLMLTRLNDIVESRGVIAIVSDKSLWAEENVWMAEVRAMVQSYLGSDLRMKSDVFSPPVESFKDVLEHSAFSSLETFTSPVSRTWSAKQILGYLYSTSIAPIQAFGDKHEDFERTILDKLHHMMPNDKFPEQNEYSVLIARRPLS